MRGGGSGQGAACSLNAGAALPLGGHERAVRTERARMRKESGPLPIERMSWAMLPHKCQKREIREPAMPAGKPVKLRGSAKSTM
jgi:hypothetical protein